MFKKNYPCIDIMRIIAAILVIGIHTYPFLQISKEFDFLTTHVLGRIAVPFFFMTTAFFLFQSGLPSSQKLKKVFKQLFMIDLISIILYLPIQIYNHSLSLSPSIIFKDLLMNGTFYHLWYLPASMIGILIVYLLLRYLSIKQSFLIVLILYIIGLGGDSYYGLSVQIPLLKNLYSGIFLFCDYTRNGVFFAPLFIILGAFIAQHPQKIHKKAWFIAGGVSFAVMFIEAYLLNHYQLPRHDAMTIALPFVMYCLFMILISFSGKRYSLCKDLSLYVYIIHPFVIVIIRLVAKFIHLENILVQNNLLHFLFVTVFSFMISYICLCIKKGGLYHDKSTNL